MNVEELLQKRLCYVMADMDKQQVVRDMVYKRVGATSLCLDIYYPEKFEHTSPLPAVLFLHGEASWEMLKDAKDWGQYTSWARLVAASGLIAVTAVRRPSERYTKLEEASQDVIDIVDYVTK